MGWLDGACDRDRTGDLVLTKDVLYRLSYAGTASSTLEIGDFKIASSTLRF